MMIQYGHADAFVGGNGSTPAAVFRALLHLVKPLPEVPRAFSAVVAVGPHLASFGSGGILFLADCGVNADPAVVELAAIGVETGKLANHYLGRTPRVVFLSHSTKGTSNMPSARRVAAATELARQQVIGGVLDIEVDGELQLDVALDPEAAEIKLPGRELKRAADALIFPNLDAGHIAVKLLQHVAGARIYGQIIVGLARPAAQVPRTVGIDSLLGTALAVGVEAIKYHQLYPDGEVR
jgi:phosphotransacetylase